MMPFTFRPATLADIPALVALEEDVEKNLGKAYLMEGALAEKMQKLLLERFVFVYEDGTPVGGTATETETEAETEAQTIS